MSKRHSRDNLDINKDVNGSKNGKVENVVKIVINKRGESADRSVYYIALTLEIQGLFQLLV